MKKPDLASALHKASGKTQETAPAETPDAPQPVSGRAPSRANKRIVAGYFDMAAVRQIKLMALNSDSSIQALLAEALNDLFVKHGQKPIA